MLITEHLVVGILVTRANKKTKTTLFILVSIISCLLADLPVLFLGRPGEVEYLSHRIYTHSLILWPFYSLIPVAITYPFFRISFKKHALYLYVISALSYLSHIFLDILTPYGVQLLYPLSKSIYSLDLFHSFDPIFTTISFIFLGLYLYKLIRRQHFTRNIVLTIVFIILSYTTITIVLKLKNHQEYYELLKERETEAKSSAIIPRTFWRWKLIASDADKYYVVFKANGISTI